MATLKTEDDVKIHYLPTILEQAGYAAKDVQYNVAIEVKQGRKKRTIFADAVVYADASRAQVAVVVETKPPTPLLDGDADQAISYARLLTPIAPVVLLTNGSAAGTRSYDTFTKKQFTGGLPSAKQVLSKNQESSGPALAAEARHELFKVDNVQEYKRILRASHNAIRNNEGYDPTKAFDELSKVMFTKLYEEKSGKDRFNVRKYDDFLEAGVNIIQSIFGETMSDSSFSGLFASDSKIELSDRTVRDLVSQFEGYDLSLTDFDVKGEAFEHFLGDTFTGGLGQYFTPRNVVDFMVDALDPKAGEKIVDPFCGTGGFLIKWHSAVSEKIAAMPVAAATKTEWTKALNSSSLYGIDWNERTSLACRMNMTVHGEGQSAKNIFKQSGFVDAAVGDDVVIGENVFDVCLTNPPFGSAESDPVIMNGHDLGAGKKSIERAALAMERALVLTRPGGWVGIIVMDGILSNSSMKPVRDYVRKHAYVRALISLTPETFEGYGGRSNTTILLLEKKLEPKDEAQVDATFMAMCRNTGYAANGEEIAGNELPAILDAYRLWRDLGTAPVSESMWVEAVRERLDPSHYWRPASTAVVDGALATELATLAAHLEETSRQLASVVSAVNEQADKVELENVALGSILSEVVELQPLTGTATYSLLGVRWWGGGAFIRETKLGSEISATTMRKVGVGRLVYNRLFAYRASFGIVGPECDGAVASSEFPMYEASESKYESSVLLRYVVHALNSPTYLALIDSESTGSTKTSRNRFKQSAFEDFEIAIPRDPADLESAVLLLDNAASLRQRLSSLSEQEKEFRAHFSSLVPGLVS